MAATYSISVPCPVEMPKNPGGQPKPPAEPVWWVRENPVGGDFEFAMLTNIKPGHTGENWTGFIETRGQYGFDVGGDPTVYRDGEWRPCDFVKDGTINVWRPKGLRWEEDEQRQGIGRWVEMSDEEAAEDDGGVPLAQNLPRPDPGETRREWEKRCIKKYPQITRKSSIHRDLLDEGWRGASSAA